jgi:SAM-dependent methyltransferase
MLGLLEAPLRALHARLGRPVQVLDAGCGRSYITMVLAWAGAQAGGVPVQVLGVDRRPDVIAASARRCVAAGLDGLARWIVAEVDAPQLAAEVVDAVIALHACDRASCDAIALGCARGAALIAVAPCCQAELARGWAALDQLGATGALRPVWTAPHLRRELGAHVTDAMRLVLLRARGYHARAIELVPDAHTRKNTLLIAEPQSDIDAASNQVAWREHDALVAATGGVELQLAARLR